MQRQKTKLPKAAVLRAIKEMAQSGLINSGALVQLDIEDLSISVVAASAASHVAPAYRFSAEAPRIYGNSTARDAEDAWMQWVGRVLGARLPYRGEFRTRREWLDQCADIIVHARQMYTEGEK